MSPTVKGTKGFESASSWYCVRIRTGVLSTFLKNTFSEPLNLIHPIFSPDILGSERGDWEFFWVNAEILNPSRFFWDIPSLHRLGKFFWGSQDRMKWGRKEEKSSEPLICARPEWLTDCMSAVDVGYNRCDGCKVVIVKPLFVDKNVVWYPN